MELVDRDGLPSNYTFEIDKTVRRIQQVGARRVGLQMPEGLLLFATAIANAITSRTPVDTVILGDVTYGACCVDDVTAAALGCDLLIHYGHSCLINVRESLVPMMYVFVDIIMDTQHCIDTLTALCPRDRRVAFGAVVQFLSSMRTVATAMKKVLEHEPWIPQAKPLSRGEMLGCTSPDVPDDINTLIFIGDGRFHLESCLIANPHIRVLQYDPYKKLLTSETYDHDALHAARKSAIAAARDARSIGVIMGTLGRQGSLPLVQRIENIALRRGGRVTTFLLSEVFPSTLARIEDIDVFVQVACPRLSIDWGTYFPRPLLTPYEAEVAFANEPYRDVYPMQHYRDDGGPWSVYAAKRAATSS